MGIVSVIPVPERSGSYGLGFARRKKRKFRVLTDGDIEDIDLVGAACGISIGDGYISWDGTYTDPLCTCSNVDVDQSDEGSRLWFVTADYDLPAISPQTSQSQQQGQSQGEGSDDPTQWLPKVTRTYGQVQVIHRKAYDREGNNTLTLCVANSAGYPFSNLPMRTVRFPVYTHTSYSATFSKEDHRDYAGALNSLDWNGYGVEKWKLDSWEVEDVYIGNVLYYLHRKVFHLCPDDLPSWQLFLLDQGTRTANGEMVIDPLTGLEVTRDVPFDGEGFDLSVADITAGNFVFPEYADHKILDFSTVFNDIVF